MKSKFTKYQKMLNLSLNNVIKNLNTNENDFYRLLTTWISQGLITESNPHFVELTKINKRKINEEKKKLNEQDYLSYKYLRQEGYSLEDISATLERDLEKVERYDRRWYQELREKDFSFDEIKDETGIPVETLQRLERHYEDRLKEREQVTENHIKNNIAYANYYLNKIEADPNEFLIIDLEGIQQPDEILEIAAINLYGETLIDTLVRPTHHISWFVTKLTGITDRMASRGKGLYQTLRDFKEIAEKKILLSWGTDYDRVLLNSAMRRTGIYIKCKFVDMQRIHSGLMKSSEHLALYKAAGEKDQSHRALDDCQLVLKILDEDLDIRRKLME